LGSAELFPQHFQLQNLSPAKHLKALTGKLATETTNFINIPKGKALIKILQAHLNALIAPPPAAAELRVTTVMPVAPTPQLEV
jgi:hypothetical protein